MGTNGEEHREIDVADESTPLSPPDPAEDRAAWEFLAKGSEGDDGSTLWFRMGHASEEGAHALSHVSEHLHEVVAGDQKAWRWVILASVLALQEFIIASFQRSTDALTDKNARRLEALTKGEAEGDWQAFLRHFDDLYRQMKREHDYEPGEEIDNDVVARDGLCLKDLRHRLMHRFTSEVDPHPRPGPHHQDYVDGD